MKQAIINYINSKAEKNKPCKHDWELLETNEWVSKLNPNYKYTQWIYRCKKCCEFKSFKGND